MYNSIKAMLCQFLLTTFVVLCNFNVQAERPQLAMAELPATSTLRLLVNRPDLPMFNRLLLRVMSTYPMDGTHDYWWPKAGEGSYDGSTSDVYLRGVKVMRGEEKRRGFCCGLTLEVFARTVGIWEGVYQDSAAALSDKNWAQFQKAWFVRKVKGPGPSDALAMLKLGRQLKAEEVLPGDFVQLWRNNGSGHSVIFLEWVRDDQKKITGFRYWSTQKSTKGIGEVVEYFGDGKKQMIWEATWYGRAELQGAPAL